MPRSCGDGAVTTRIAALSDVHGNATALAAVRKAIAAAKPDAILVAGDHVLNGPEPAAAVDAIRELEADGALVVQGNTDIAVADYDWAAAFPWLEGPTDSIRFAAEWAHDALGDERLDWLRRLPAERRLHVEDTMVLVTHASPGSQTAGFDQTLDPSVTIERLSRTDARLICCGHTHLPEVRDFGWKQVINDGSAGYVFDGDPTASWALIELDGEAVTTTIQRTEYDVQEVSNALSARGLPGDIYRAATVRTGKLVR
jgi:putative phosphoesterase